MESLIIILLIAAALVILYEYRYNLSFLRYRQTLQSVKKNVEQPSKPVPQRICPRCDDVMEEGYLVGPNGIYWSRDNLPTMPQSMPFFRPSVGSEPLTLSPGFPYSGITSNLKAYRCRKCGIILADSKSLDFRII